MSYSVNWITKVITIPTSDLTLVSGTRYSLNMYTFLIEIRRLESAFDEGLWADQILDHTNPKLDFASANYAGFDELINGYTIQITGVVTRVDLIGSNNNIIDVFIPTGVSMVPSNSAGLTVFKEVLEMHGQIVREIWLDTSLLINGIGYQQSPYNNENDAIDDLEDNGLHTLVLLSDLTLTRNLKNIAVRGVGTPTVDLAGYDLKGSEFRRVKLEGNYSSEIIVQESVLLTGMYLNGYFENNALAGDLICVDGSEVFMKNNSSAIAGLGRPTISMNGVGWSKLSVRDQDGGLTIKDCNNINDEVTVEMARGSLTFDGSCSNGIMVARTSGKFVDLATAAGALVEREAFAQDTYTRFDLNPYIQNTYDNVGAYITNSQFTLTNSDNGDGTFDVVFSLT